MEIKNCSAIVTGGASGMGAATAKMLREAGAKVALFDVNLNALQSMANQIDALAVECDVTNPQSVEAAIAKVNTAFGPARICINCAGIVKGKRMVGQQGAMPLEEFRQVIEINLIGTFNVMRLAAASMMTLDPLNEKGIAKEVIVLTIGPIQCQETLRTALAMGADRGILVETNAEIQSLAVAKILRAIVEKEACNMVVLGKQAVDSDNNQTGQMLAGLLNWPQGTFASKLSIEQDRVQVTREIDGGLETLSLKLPAIITTDLRLNEPRYLSLPNIVQAKRKPIMNIPILELNVDIAPRFRILKVTLPQKRRTGVKVADVKELLHKLKHEAQVI